MSAVRDLIVYSVIAITVVLVGYYALRAPNLGDFFSNAIGGAVRAPVDSRADGGLTLLDRKVEDLEKKERDLDAKYAQHEQTIAAAAKDLAALSRDLREQRAALDDLAHKYKEYQDVDMQQYRELLRSIDHALQLLITRMDIERQQYPDSKRRDLGATR